MAHEQQRFDVVTPESIKNEFLGLTESGETLLKLFDKHNRDASVTLKLLLAETGIGEYFTKCVS